MNYILKQLNKRIDLLSSLGKNHELKIHLQSKLEYYLIFILGYLWNKNIDKLNEEKKEEILKTILKPSIEVSYRSQEHLILTRKSLVIKT